MADWSNEHIEKLKRCWAEGLSATQIVKQFDYEFSRSAILGKVNRLNLKPRRAAYGKGTIAERKPHHKPRPNVLPRPVKNTESKPLPLPPPPPPIEKPKRFRNRLPKEFYDNAFFFNWIANLTPKLRDIYCIPRDKECKFIIGEVMNPTSYWCRKTTRGGSWCDYHHKLVYQPPEQRRRTR
jgi:GcrA cell cycle regulator